MTHFSEIYVPEPKQTYDILLSSIDIKTYFYYAFSPENQNKSQEIFYYVTLCKCVYVECNGDDEFAKKSKSTYCHIIVESSYTLCSCYLFAIMRRN